MSGKAEFVIAAAAAASVGAWDGCLAFPSNMAANDDVGLVVVADAAASTPPSANAAAARRELFRSLACFMRSRIDKLVSLSDCDNPLLGEVVTAATASVVSGGGG